MTRALAIRPAAAVLAPLQVPARPWQAPQRAADQYLHDWTYTLAAGLRSGSPDLSALDRASAARDVDAAVRIMLDAADAMDASLDAPIRRLVEQTLRAGGAAAASSLRTGPLIVAAARPVPVVGFNLDTTNQAAQDWAKRYAAKLVRQVGAETRKAIRAIVERAFSKKIPPKILAREIRDVVGLTSQQATAVSNLRERLRANPGTVVYAGKTRIRLPEEGDALDARIGTAIRRYSDELLTQRAETIARTETIRASMEGQRQLWLQAVDDGLLTGDEQRVWIVAPDDRLCPFCADMEDQQVGLEEEFESDEYGAVLGPPLHPNCRCATGLADAPSAERRVARAWVLPVARLLEFDESKHPREPAGSEKGGEFTAAPGGVSFAVTRVGFGASPSAKMFGDSLEAFAKTTVRDLTEKYPVLVGINFQKLQLHNAETLAGLDLVGDDQHATGLTQQSTGTIFLPVGEGGEDKLVVGANSYRVNPSAEGSFRHEVGHLASRLLAKDQVDEWFKIAKAEAKKISRYAASGGPVEAFPEAFSAFVHPDYKAGSLPKRTETFLRNFLKSAPRAAEFNPDQPRDEKGQWADTGSATPKEPGTTPIPPGMVRGYHYTGADMAPVLKEGLDVQHAKGSTYGEPNAIWFSTAKPGDFKNYVEVFIKPDEIAVNGPLGAYDRKNLTPEQQQQRLDDFNQGDHDFFLGIDKVPPDRFATHHEPWHARYRYIQKNPELITQIVAGEHDWLMDNPEYAPALALVKKQHAQRSAEFDPNQPRDEAGKWTDAGAASGTVDAPRVFRTPDDIEKVSGWPGDQERWQWKAEPGHLVSGRPLDRSTLPAELYHVTTAAPAVEASGLLLGQNKDAGLGGGQADGVSFTSDAFDARTIQRELTRSVRIARGDDTIDSIEQYARQDEAEAGLPPGTLDRAVAAAQQMWDTNYDAGRRANPVYATEASRRSLTKDAFNSYLGSRDRDAMAALGLGWEARDRNPLKNPILFGDQRRLAQIDPGYVRTLRVPTENIPASALITSGSDAFLHEVRVYADVPVLGMRHNAEWSEADHPRDEAGKFTDVAGVPVSRPTPDEPRPGYVVDETQLTDDTVAEREFQRALRAQYPRGLMLFHETDTDQAKSFLEHGAFEDGTFGAIGTPSNYVLSPDKAIVRLRVLPSQYEFLRPDANYSDANLDNSYANLLRDHAGVYRAYVSLSDAVPPSRVSVTIQRGGPKPTSVSPRGAEWNEADHPRDKTGEFSDSGGGQGPGSADKGGGALAVPPDRAVMVKAGSNTSIFSERGFERRFLYNPKTGETILGAANDRSEESHAEAFTSVIGSRPFPNNVRRYDSFSVRGVIKGNAVTIVTQPSDDVEASDAIASFVASALAHGANADTDVSNWNGGGRKSIASGWPELTRQRAAMGAARFAEFVEAQHPRDPGGKFTDKGAGLSDRAQRALQTYKPSTRAIQRKAAAGEAIIARALGGRHLDDHEPVDVIVESGGRTAGVEVKTLIDNAHDKITMHPESRVRKEQWARANHAIGHTVVVDVRGSRPAYYYKAGFGAFRISAMERVTLAGLRVRIGGLRAAEFDPEQPRDEAGRWIDGGGRSSVGPSLTVVRGAFDFASLGSRRFMFEPNTEAMVFGRDHDDGYGDWFQISSHAEEFAKAKRADESLGSYDAYIRGVVESKDPNGTDDRFIDIQNAHGKHLPGGLDDPRAALFDAVRKCLERFSRAGAPLSVRVVAPSVPGYESTLGSALRGLAEFDESKHPRDGGGRFTNSQRDALQKLSELGWGREKVPLSAFGIEHVGYLQMPNPDDSPLDYRTDEVLSPSSELVSVQPTGMVDVEKVAAFIRSYDKWKDAPGAVDVHQHADGRSYVTDGHHRWIAARLMGKGVSAKVTHYGGAVHALAAAEWDESEHPRNKDGEFADKGNGTVGHTLSVAEHTVAFALRETLVSKNEHLVLLDGNGNEIGRSVGSRHTASVPDRLLRRLDDPGESLVMFHTHPVGDHDFSGHDIKDFAYSPGVHKSVVVTKATTYVLTKTPLGRTASNEDWVKAMGAAFRAGDIDAMADKLPASGLVTYAAIQHKRRGSK